MEKFFRIINIFWMWVLLLLGILALIAVFCGKTHQWVVVVFCCVFYILMYYETYVKNNKKGGTNDTRGK
jgi:uncharacterized membrane protein